MIVALSVGDRGAATLMLLHLVDVTEPLREPEAIRTALTVGTGIGGVVALILASPRQRSTACRTRQSRRLLATLGVVFILTSACAARPARAEPPERLFFGCETAKRSIVAEVGRTFWIDIQVRVADKCNDSEGDIDDSPVILGKKVSATLTLKTFPGRIFLAGSNLQPITAVPESAGPGTIQSNGVGRFWRSAPGSMNCH